VGFIIDDVRFQDVGHKVELLLV